MKKKLLLLLPFLLLAGCKAREKPDIVVTSFVSYDAVTNIVGDKLKVKNIVPWGSELHDFEPTPRDIEDINNAKLFVYTHPALETWVKDLVTNKNSFDMSIHSDVEYACKVKKQEHHDHEHDHDHTLHYWTDPHIYIRVMNDLLTVLIDISPANETYFTENHNNYTARLLATSNDFRDFLFPPLEKPPLFFAGHNALGYFAAAYKLTIKTISESYKPDVDFLSQEIIDFMYEIKIFDSHYLFIEELVEPRVANLIKNELAKENYATTLLELHGYHNITAAQAKEGITYADIFAQNVANIKQAFGG